MSSETAALTVDSLVKFNFKKKFSFANRKLEEEEDDDEEEETVAKISPSKNKKFQPKGSAVLKSKSKKTKQTKKKNASSSSSASFSSSDSDESESSSNENKKTTKQIQKKKKKGSDSSDDEMTQKLDTKLKQLYEMFPTLSQTHIRELFLKKNCDSRVCIDLLLVEKYKAANRDKNDEESDNIEEWSDGDETIKKKNAEKRKSPINNEELKEPSKKKARKVIVLSDEDDEAEQQKPSQSKKSSAASSAASSTLNSSTEESKNKKIIKKKAVIKSSDDDDDNDENSNDSNENKKKQQIEDEDDEEEKKEEEPSTKSKHKHKSSKKHKKEKKKNRRKNADSDADFDDGEDFCRDEVDIGSEDSVEEEEVVTEEQKIAILSMCNEAPAEDIQSMISISPKRLKLLISLRPFKTYPDLHKRLTENNLIKVIESARDIIYARSIVSDVLNKCQQISDRMNRQVTALIESSNADGSQKSDESNTLEIKSQPTILNNCLSLKPYQLIGLNWLCLMHKEKINGILADEMGLGKTCQTISFLAHLFETNSKMMHLIIVPPSTLDNWIREISTWCSKFQFTVYQGSLDERRRIRFDVLNKRFEKPLNAILTTYGLISSTNEDKAFFKKLHFEYCVFDEAHMLKNMNSLRYQSLIKINSNRKLLLTGTPLQNNLVELMSLLYFVMPNIFHHKTQYINKIFASKPANVDTDTFYNDKIAQAKGIMKPFILRRLKNDVLKQLPKKVEEIICCEMSQRQQKEYNKLVAYYKKRKDELEILKAEKQKEKELEKEANKDDLSVNLKEIYNLIGTSTSHARKSDQNKENEDSSSNILMELRKAANHPLLRRTYYDNEKLNVMAKLIMKESSPDTVLEYVLEDLQVLNDFQIHKICGLYKGLKEFQLDNQMICNSGKFTVLNSLLEEKRDMGDRVLMFSQFVIMLDIAEEFLKIKGYKYLRLDGTTAVTERQDMIDTYNNDNEIFVFLLSTKAGGVGINLTAANVVIMHDIDFNPFNDKQAEDRCHRVGQTREVQVYKLISKSSIDETMLKTQQRKLELGADISGENGGNDQAQSKADMISLLKEALKV